MQTYAIDIQGLYDKEHNFFPKELTIMLVETPFIGHWVIKSTHSFQELPYGIMNINRKLTRLSHGIEWSDGECSEEKLQFFLHRLAHTATRVYVEGNHHAVYLEKFMSCEIIESTTVAPPIMSLPKVDNQCVLHGIERQGKYTCSYNRAERLKDWIRINNHIYEEILSPYETIV